VTAGSGGQFCTADHYQDQTAPVESRSFTGGSAMYGFLHEQVARQRHREACLEARRVRMARAVRADRRARRAVEVAVRANERVGVEVVVAR
jgi:hypothetical protein